MNKGDFRKVFKRIAKVICKKLNATLSTEVVDEEFLFDSNSILNPTMREILDGSVDGFYLPFGKMRLIHSYQLVCVM